MENERHFLGERELMRLRGDSRGVLLRSVEGALWVTQEGDACDHVLRAGESLTVDRPGLVLIQALEPARVEFVDRRPAGVRAWLHRPRLGSQPCG